MKRDMPMPSRQRTSDTSEHVEITGVWIAPESFLDLQSQPLHTSPHVCSPDSQPHPYARRQTQTEGDGALRERHHHRDLVLPIFATLRTL